MLASTWRKLSNLGVEASDSFDERKKTKLINVCYLVMLPVFMVFGVVNLVEGRSYLGFTNLLVALISVVFLTLNYFQQLKAARVYLLMITTACFTCVAYKYNTGIEYFLLVNMVISALLYDRKMMVLPLTVLNASLFVYLTYHIHYSQSANLLEVVPYYRILIRIILSLIVFIIAVQYFIHEHAKSRKQVEKSNSKLARQQTKMLEQTALLEEKNNQLEVLNKTKEKLFTIVAHDMRAPIASLKASLDLFNKNLITKEEFHNLSAELTIQVDQLWDNLDNLLQWSKTQLTGIEVRPINTSLKQVLLDVLGLLQGNIQNKKIEVQINCPGGLDAYADVNHVKIIIRNLLSNAIKFSHVGGKIIINGMMSEQNVCITVQDYGKGMTETQLDKLFSYYDRKITHGTLNEKGTGLGLMLSREFAEKNAGSITVVSHAGEGSTFKVCLPRA